MLMSPHLRVEKKKTHCNTPLQIRFAFSTGAVLLWGSMSIVNSVFVGTQTLVPRENDAKCSLFGGKKEKAMVWFLVFVKEVSMSVRSIKTVSVNSVQVSLF